MALKRVCASFDRGQYPFRIIAVQGLGFAVSTGRSKLARVLLGRHAQEVLDERVASELGR